MSQPTSFADKQNFAELMAIMKGGENSRSIEAMIEKIKTNKNLLRWVDKDSCTAMHKGILEGCQAEKINSLLAIDPSLARDKHKGRLPLHLALEHNAKEDLLDRLLDFYPLALEIPDINDGRLPLHLILEHQPFPASFVTLGINVLSRYPEAARRKSHDRLPLQICLEGNLRPKLTIEVIRAFRGAACIPSREGKLPLHIAVEQNLDPRVVDLLIEAHPAALITKMVASPGQDWTVLEFAIRNHRATLMVKSLLHGGSQGKSPKAIAYARAAAVGRITKDAMPDKRATASRRDFDYSEELAPGSRRKLHFSIQPFAGEQINMEIDPTEKVEMLKKKIEDSEGTPAEKMRLTKDGVQLLDGYELTHYGLVRGCVVRMKPRFEVLQQALRHGAESVSILQLLEMRPEAAGEDDQHGALPLELGIYNKAAEEVIIKLLDQYPEAAKKPCSSGGELGEYPLHTALRQMYSANVIGKLLKDCVADDWTESGAYAPEWMERREAGGSLLPLHMAIRAAMSPENKLKIINKLLPVKCPIGARDPVNGYSALDVVLSTKPVAIEVFNHIYQELRAARPAVATEQGKNGQCPLHIAVVHNAGQVIIEKLCNVAPKVLEVYDVDGRLPIHLAVSCGASFAVVKSLLTHGPSTLMKADGHGKTPLQLAVSHKAQPGVVFEICRTDKKTLNAKDARGRSLLELALSHDAPPWVIQELLEAAPAEMSNLNLLSGKWPNTKASSEALRFAFEARRKSAAGQTQGSGRMMTPALSAPSSPTGYPSQGGSPSRQGASDNNYGKPSSARNNQSQTPQEGAPEDDSVLGVVGRWFGF